MKTPLLKQKPGQQLAYLSHPQVENLAQYLVAFANSAGGLVVLGVDESGRVVNDILPEDVEPLLQEAMVMCRPPVVGIWQNIPVAQGQLIGIRVERSVDLHSLYDGSVWVRSGRENRPLNGGELVQLAQGRTSGDYEEEVVPGTTIAEFDEEIIQLYLAKREERGHPFLGSRRELLFEIGAVAIDGRPTVAGMLLFGKNPQAFLPHSGAVFVRFASDTPRTESGEAGYGRRDEVRGTLPRIIERLWSIVWEEMRVGAVVQNLERRELTEYPPFAVRECLVNAVCHRDYRIKGRRIEIRMYSDRLEVISPGGLPGYITLDNLVDEHYSRNPRLVNGLYQWGYIEELGLGIDRMIDEMGEAGHPPPQFKATDYSFTVTLASKPGDKTAGGPAGGTLNERQARALAYIREQGSITSEQYQFLWGQVRGETLQRDLTDLVKRGLVLQIGSKKGTYYILK